MTVQVHIENIFPTPIYCTHIEQSHFDNLNFDEIEFESNDDPGSNRFTWISMNEQLLETEAFAHLKPIIDEHVYNYFQNILGYVIGDIYPVMTTSWLTKCFNGQISVDHVHINSILSGVLYVKVPDGSGDLCFKRKERLIPFLSPKIACNTDYNVDVRHFPVRTGLLLLFPSTLSHYIDKHMANSERYSIAFNYFLKGEFNDRTAKLSLR